MKVQNEHPSMLLAAEALRAIEAPAAAGTAEKSQATQEIGSAALRFAAQVRGRAPTDLEKQSSALKSLAMSFDGLAGMFQANAEKKKIMHRIGQVMEAVDEAFPRVTSLATADGAAMAKLAKSLEAVGDAGYAYLGQLGDEKEQHLASAVAAVVRFARNATATAENGAEVLAHADAIGGGLLPGRVGLEVARTIDVIATGTGIPAEGVAEAFKWYMGKMTEIGFQDPKKFYQELESQTKGNAPQVGLPIKAAAVADRAMYAARVVFEAAKKTLPDTSEALIDAVSKSIEVRSSDTHPLLVAWMPTDTPGKLGVTLAPGKKQPSLFSYIWDRNLDKDLDTLAKQHGVKVLVPLVEDWELQILGIGKLVETAQAKGMEVRRLQITDQETPKPEAASALADFIVQKLNAGENVLVHCKGGLGRAGTIAALSLLKLGMDPKTAIATVREHRPGAIENAKQEKFIEAMANSG